jgi:hypothetical protein
MKIEFYNKETGNTVKCQDDFMVDTNGRVWEKDYFSSLPMFTYMQNDNIGWRVVNE